MNDLNVRWLIGRDLPQVMEIENSSPRPDSEEDIIEQLKRRNCIGMVVDTYPTQSIDSELLGYMIYELHHNRIYINNFIVHPDYRRHGVGTAMADNLRRKLSDLRRSRIIFEVPESDLESLLFFKAQGYRATEIIYDLYDDDEDAYQMEFDITAKPPVVENRIKQYLT